MSKAKDIRQRSWLSLNGKWGTMAIIALIVYLIDGALGGLSVVGIGAIALIVVTGPLTLGVAKTDLKLVRGGGDVEIANAFEGFNNFVNAFVLGLLRTIFIFLWSLLLIVPGIIKAYSYSMSFYILADNPQMDGSSALKLSMELMHGRKWKLFCLDISFIGWFLLCILTFGILLFWVTPYHDVARAHFYQEILAEINGLSVGQNGNGVSNDGRPSDAPYTNAAADGGQDGNVYGSSSSVTDKPSTDAPATDEPTTDVPATKELPAGGSQPDDPFASDDPPINADDL